MGLSNLEYINSHTNHGLKEQFLGVSRGGGEGWLLLISIKVTFLNLGPFVYGRIHLNEL